MFLQAEDESLCAHGGDLQVTHLSKAVLQQWKPVLGMSTDI